MRGDALLAFAVCVLAAACVVELAVIADVVGGYWAAPLVLAMLPFFLAAIIAWKILHGIDRNL